MVSLAVMLVFAGFLPPASPRAHDPSDETSAQVGRFASGGEAALFQVLGLASVGCPAVPALVHLPACLGPRPNATACFDSTRGFPGEGPNSDSTAMDADKFGNEPAAAASNDDQLRIANEVGCKEFGELWDEMACKITGSAVQKSCTLLYKCRCTSLQRVAAGGAVNDERTLADLKVLKHNQKMGSVEGWAQACQLPKDYIHRSHCGEKCTPTLIANKNPPTKRPHENDWLGQANAEWKKQKAETAHSKAVAESERNATDLVQEIATLRAKNKTLQDGLTKHKAAADRRLQPIDPNNADSFDYEREDPGTDDDDGAECPATTSAVGPQRATPPKTRAWWKLLRIGQILTYNKVECKVVSVDDKPAGPSVTVELLAGESKGTCVSVNRWSDLVDVGQKFWHPRKGKPCSVIQITRGHVDGEPSL